MKYIGDAILKASFTPLVAKPMDARLVVDSEAELYEIDKKYAYNGMPVVHAATGSIYVLTDKELINKPQGWTASYETIQMKQCTKSEYESWLSNTLNNKPIDETKGYIRDGVYYYIIEDSLSEEDINNDYVSYALYSDLEKRVLGKANESTLTNILSTIQEIKKAYADYSTYKETFLTKSEFEEGSLLLTILSDYSNTKKLNDILSKYVKVDDVSDDLGFKFADRDSTKTKFDELDKSVIKTNSDGSLNSLNVKTVKSGNNILNIETAELNNDKLALEKDVPKIEVMSEDKYLNLTQKDSNKYYVTYTDDASELGYVTLAAFNNFKKNYDSDFVANYLETVNKLNALAELYKDSTDPFNVQEQIDSLKALFNTTTTSLADYKKISDANSDKTELKDLISAKLNSSDLKELVEAIVANIPNLINPDLTNYVQTEALDNYAKKDDIPTDYIKKEELTDISNLARKSELVEIKQSIIDLDDKYTTLNAVKLYLEKYNLPDTLIASSKTPGKTLYEYMSEVISEQNATIANLNKSLKDLLARVEKLENPEEK